MSTTADLPPSAKPAANPAGNGGASGRRTATTQDDYRSWIVLWTELDAFYTACFDLTETIVISVDPPASIVRVVPLQHPNFPLIHALEAQYRALTSSEVYDEEAPYENWYEYCVVTVHFGVLPYSFTDRPFVSVRRAGRSSVVALPIGSLKFAGNNELIDLPPGIPVFQEDFVVTWHEITDLAGALGTIEPLAGKVSSAAVTVGGRSYAAGTLHFPEFDAEEAISIGGSRKAQLSFPVRWRPRPTWLQMFRKDGTVDTVTGLGLQTDDLNPLFG